MPNYCSCALVVEGDPEDIARFRKLAIRNDKFKFTHVVPMPEALQGLRVGSATIDGERVEVWREVEQPDGTSKSTKVDVAALEAAYGTASWYDWAIQNWGTKWDVSASIEVDQPDKLQVNFETAWAPPFQWLESASDDFGELVFTLAYAEGGMGFYGEATAHGGLVNDESHDGAFWKDQPDDIDEDDWFEKPDQERVVPEVAELITRYGIGTGG